MISGSDYRADDHKTTDMKTIQFYSFKHVNQESHYSSLQ